jgi:hypothetical protein
LLVKKSTAFAEKNRVAKRPQRCGQKHGIKKNIKLPFESVKFFTRPGGNLAGDRRKFLTPRKALE